MQKRIHVTQSQMPNREKFHAYVDQILDSGWLTNRVKNKRDICLMIDEGNCCIETEIREIRPEHPARSIKKIKND